nr:MAG TPA: hypothetical protein [Caudoviricetes sp.]
MLIIVPDGRSPQDEGSFEIWGFLFYKVKDVIYGKDSNFS